MADHKEEWLNRMTATLAVDPEDLIDVATMFFDDIDERLDSIAEAGHSGDYSELFLRLVHGLKGDAANIGFMDISDIARELERQIKAQAVVNFDQQVDALRAATVSTRETLGF